MDSVLTNIKIRPDKPVWVWRLRHAYLDNNELYKSNVTQMNFLFNMLSYLI